jgi:hypothetical protein
MKKMVKPFAPQSLYHPILACLTIQSFLSQQPGIVCHRHQEHFYSKEKLLKAVMVVKVTSGHYLDFQGDQHSQVYV